MLRSLLKKINQRMRWEKSNSLARVGTYVPLLKDLYYFYEIIVFLSKCMVVLLLISNDDSYVFKAKETELQWNS